MVNGVAQVQRVRPAEIRGPHRRRPAEALGARHRHRRGRRPRCKRRTSTCRPARWPAASAPSRCKPTASCMNAGGLRADDRSPTATAIRCGSTKWRASTTASRTTRRPAGINGAAQHHAWRSRSSPASTSSQVVDAIKALLPSLQRAAAAVGHRSTSECDRSDVHPRIGARRQVHAAAHARASSSLVIFLFLRNVSGDDHPEPGAADVASSAPSR